MTKADRRRVDSFELWCWSRLQKISWTEKVPNRVVLATASPPPHVPGGDGAQIKAVLLWTHNESRWYGEFHFVGIDRGHKTKRQAVDQVDGWSDRGMEKGSDELRSAEGDGGQEQLEDFSLLSRQESFANEWIESSSLQL